MKENESTFQSEISYLTEEKPVGFLITTVAAGFESEFLKRLKAVKIFSTISSADHSVLRCIALNEISSVEIARKLGLSKQAIGKTVASLEERGFIIRKESKADGRRQILIMTAKGQKLLVKSIQVAKELENLTVDNLGPRDLKLLKGILTKLVP